MTSDRQVHLGAEHVDALRELQPQEFVILARIAETVWGVMPAYLSSPRPHLSALCAATICLTLEAQGS